MRIRQGSKYVNHRAKIDSEAAPGIAAICVACQSSANLQSTAIQGRFRKRRAFASPNVSLIKGYSRQKPGFSSSISLTS